jgi:hypothetical protein
VTGEGSPVRVRTLILCAFVLLGACGTPSPRPTDLATIPTHAPDAAGTTAPDARVAAAATWRDGPGGFPLPTDADAGTQMLGHDITFQIPRVRDEIHTQLLAKLAADGYVVDTEQLVMGGYRMSIHRTADGQMFFVSVTENGDSTLMTITVK